MPSPPGGGGTGGAGAGDGVFGAGGAGACSSGSCGGGGGGGWWGGGGGTFGGGGGGSGFGPAGVSFQTGVRSGAGQVLITFTTAAQAITDLQAQVSGLGLPKGLTTALNSKLQDALDDLAADDTAGACGSRAGVPEPGESANREEAQLRAGAATHRLCKRDPHAPRLLISAGAAGLHGSAAPTSSRPSVPSLAAQPVNSPLTTDDEPTSSL